MSQMSKLCVRFNRDRYGATSIEYALIAGLIAMVIVFSVTALGETLAVILAGVEAGFDAQ